jgi:hypothetical protein
VEFPKVRRGRYRYVTDDDRPGSEGTFNAVEREEHLEDPVNLAKKIGVTAYGGVAWKLSQ